jgi:hypothetical protein
MKNFKPQNINTKTKHSVNIINYKSVKTPTEKVDKMSLINSLIGSLNLPPEYDDPEYDRNYDKLREECYRDRGLL